MILPVLPRMFDEDFYNNGVISNEFGVTPKDATFGAITNKQRKFLRTIHETIIDRPSSTPELKFL